jgi:hypothetical protein
LGKCLARLCGEGLFVAPVNCKVRRGPSVRNLSNMRGTIRAPAGEQMEVRGLIPSHVPAAGPAPPLAQSHISTPDLDLPLSSVTCSPKTLPPTRHPPARRCSDVVPPPPHLSRRPMARSSSASRPSRRPMVMVSTTPWPPLLPRVPTQTGPSPPRRAPARLHLTACVHDRLTCQPPRH